MTEPASPPGARPWLPYVAPMATFLVLTSLEGYLPGGTRGPAATYYPIFYAFKIAAVVAALAACRSTFRDLRPGPGPGGLGLATGIGLLVLALWVGLDGYYPTLDDLAHRILPRFFGTPGARAEFDPNVLKPAARVAFLAVRFFGLALVVPLMEELFWRSFVVRYVIDPDRFGSIPIGRITPAAAAITAALFAAEHPAEWLPALITGGLWAWLLWRTRSVAACFVSHAVANLGLGVYVMMTGSWKFW